VVFSQRKPQGSVMSYIELSYKVFHTCMGHSGDSRVHMQGSQEGESCTPRKACNSGSYNRSDFARFVCSCISLSGPLSCYGSPDFSIIKSFSALVFPLGFFQGYLPKNIGVYVCLILVSLFMLPLHISLITQLCF
jgi:hypothetical protein